MECQRTDYAILKGKLGNGSNTIFPSKQARQRNLHPLYKQDEVSPLDVTVSLPNTVCLQLSWQMVSEKHTFWGTW